MTEENKEEIIVVVPIETISVANAVDLRECPRGVWYFVFSEIYGLYFACLKAEDQDSGDPAFKMMLKQPAPMLWCPLSAPIDPVADALLPLSIEDSEFLEGFYKDAYTKPQKSDYFIFDENLTAQIQAMFDKYCALPGMEKWVKEHKKQPLPNAKAPV